ncbi:MAG: DEAD/DEAH box helicase [Candidatus Melainabacteria bacterium]|nr:DEAD/DEAH box helicase [Candidatus Melainabacteria bacterium]
MMTAIFTLDPFQEEAINALKSGVSVVVSAPTGSGKTAIAEFVIEEALKGSERVFYTTPLKALSNQKFHDFQKKYGKENIGIITGDTSVNSDAQIVVMTTEIYRNMLYGTVLGSVDENLKHLRYLVLDECHYMNDPERGTVWEESIIYSPPGLQVLALSATIANAKELTDWISNIHNKTKLIETFHRPVPLRFYYFKQNHLYPLLLQNKELNPQLKIHKDSFKAHKQKFKDMKRKGSKEGRIPDVVIELHKRGLLPAIYFVFSRRGCELALKDCQQLGFNLLTLDERKTLSKLIQEKTYGNDYLFKHKHLGFLYQGMAVHHAGLLPQWKTIVEELFSKGLIKVVFATETLAAGINMPAKTTVISNLGKHGGAGHKNLTSNEFLQMSGRAGRRGMDKVGNVVIKETIDHSPAFAAKLAAATANPLTSQFTPNYSMALNLLQHHSMDQIKDLLNKSFGQYLLSSHEDFYWDGFLNLTKVLTKLGYLKDNIPTEHGIMASSLRGENILLISEILLKCDFVLQPQEFSACISSLAIDETRPRIYIRAKQSINVEDTFISMQKISKSLIKLQRNYNIEMSANINPQLAGLIEIWCKEETRWEDLLRLTNLDEGDLVRATRRTMDLLRHIKNAPYMNPQIIDLAKEAIELMNKEPVKEIV